MRPHSAITVAQQTTGKGELCRRILKSLPEWFGIPESIENYASDAESLPMFVAMNGKSTVGFISLKFNTGVSAEAYVLGVMREWHRQGVGRVLFAAAGEAASERGAKYLTVKTLAADHPSPHYAATRRFYEAIGFDPIEVFPTLWHPSNPCLLMLKPLVRPNQAT